MIKTTKNDGEDSGGTVLRKIYLKIILKGSRLGGLVCYRKNRSHISGVATYVPELREATFIFVILLNPDNNLRFIIEP